jgi:hypothetical protein
MASAAPPILARNILLLCRIFGSLKRQIYQCFFTSESVLYYNFSSKLYKSS